MFFFSNLLITPLYVADNGEQSSLCMLPAYIVVAVAWVFLPSEDEQSVGTEVLINWVDPNLNFIFV